MSPQEILKVIVECAERAVNSVQAGEDDEGYATSYKRFLDPKLFIQALNEEIEEYETISTKTP